MIEFFYFFSEGVVVVVVVRECGGAIKYTAI